MSAVSGWTSAIISCALGACALGACALGACTLAACALSSSQRLERSAHAAHLERGLFVTPGFDLVAWVRMTRPGEPVRIYIEGDGHAWASRFEPSRDPTPRHAIGLALATVDPAANVVYLARPCQYAARSRRCEAGYWMQRRFAPEVIESMNAAVEQIAALAHAPVELIGFSGGGAAAVMIAARRHDVLSLRTVAGALDTAEIMRLHGVSPLTGSINPIDFAGDVAGIPQIHFLGAQDAVVPAAVATRFALRAGGSCVTLRDVPAMTHQSDWRAVWPRLLAEKPRCR